MFSPVYAIEIPHEDIMWEAGYWSALTDFNPIEMNDVMGWDKYLMYEPLFGTDVATGHLIKWLGKSIQWEDDGTTYMCPFVMAFTGLTLQIGMLGWHALAVLSTIGP